MKEYIIKIDHPYTYGMTELIRCKDCEMRKNNICHNPNTFGAIVTDMYFCADGKVKGGEQE